MSGVAGNYFLAETGGNILGPYWLWAAAFILLPGISHVVFIILHLHMIKKQKELKVRNAIDYQIPHTELFADPHQPVTPFASIPDPHVEEKVEQDSPSIFKEMRDPAIDELLERGNWWKAYHAASLSQKKAHEEQNAKLTELYQAYLDEIRLHLGF